MKNYSLWQLESTEVNLLFDSYMFTSKSLVKIRRDKQKWDKINVI